MKDVSDNTIEFGNNIMFKGEDFTHGLWPSLSKLAQFNGLETTTKVRVAAIYREVNKMVGTFQSEYEKAVEELKWEGAGPQRKCLEPEKLKELNEQYSQRPFVLTGKKLKLASVDKALNAQDLVILSPFIEEQI